MDLKVIINRIKPVLILVAVMWAVFILSIFMPLNNYGIVPRTTEGLWGILFSPFLHGSFSHLTANSLSFLMLGSMLVLFEHRKTVAILIFLVLLSGLGTWIIGRSDTAHIGASGVIYGILGFLIVSGIFNRSFKYLVLSISVFFLYGGMIFGILPVDRFVSWEGHMCGFFSGIILAWVFSKK